MQLHQQQQHSSTPRMGYFVMENDANSREASELLRGVLLQQPPRLLLHVPHGLEQL